MKDNCSLTVVKNHATWTTWLPPGARYVRPRSPEKFENAALFLRLGLPSTLIHLENEAFPKRFSNRRTFKTPLLRFSLKGNYFENRAFRKRWCHDNHVISLPKFSLNTNVSNFSNLFFAFSNFSSAMWEENIWCVFGEKPPFSNFSGVV